MKLLHSAKRRPWTIVLLVTAMVATITGVGISSAFVGTTPSSATPTACPAGSSLQSPKGSSQEECVITSTGTPVGGVKHVWLIILENKSYDETFSGLNQNSLPVADAP